MNTMRWAAALLALIPLAGCAGLPLQRTGPPADRPPVSEPMAEPGERSGVGAAAALLGEAATAEARGEAERAAALLERAIRVDPANPLPWSRLAELRLHQGQTGLAEQLAVKSNRLAGADRELEARNWRTIARGRRRAGDSIGARQAEEAAERATQR